jgi:tetratricopeptide (TPR) repeat protein
MNLPIRTPAHLEAQAKKRNLDPKSDPAVLSEMFVADCIMGHQLRDWHQFHRLFIERKDRKLGSYVLLNTTGITFAKLDEAGEFVNKTTAAAERKTWWKVDPVAEHPKSALAVYLSDTQKEAVNRELPGPRTGFIQLLARTQSLWYAMHTQHLNRVPEQQPIYKAKVIDFLHDTPTPIFAYAILDTMQRKCNIAPTDRMTEIAVKRFGPITSPLGLGYVQRYEYARSLYQAGLSGDGAAQYRALYADTLKLGALPPLDAGFRDALKTDGAGFVGFIRTNADELIAKKRHGLALQLAAQMDALGDTALCDEILAAIPAKASDKERTGLTLACANAQYQRKNFAQADRLLAKLLEDKELAQHPELWRWRSALNAEMKKSAESVKCLEKALDLEFAELPEVVNVESIRADYRVLMEHYQKYAEASALVEKSTAKAFLARVIRTADRWRLIDPDASEACRLAGKILATAGERDLAWDYWTTPIDLSPAESKPWLELAEALKSEGDLERADRAYALGFEAEPTNPEILWKRAQNLARLGQAEQARTLYRQIADGRWQDRFNPTVEQARSLAGK